jgi:hypothetical protein
MQSVKLFFNKIQVTCVGARVMEFAMIESDHALIARNRLRMGFGSEQRFSSIARSIR